MSNLNKAMLIGRVGQEPEVRDTQTGQKVANLSIATNDYWKDKQGQKQEKTEWHNIVVWGNQAEFVQNYVHKGRLIYVEGRLQTSTWTDNQNVKHYKTEVVASTIQLLDRPAEGEQQGGQQGPQGQSQQPGGGQETQGQAGQPEANQGGGEEPFDEDLIPF